MLAHHNYENKKPNAKKRQQNSTNITVIIQNNKCLKQL